MSAIVSFTLMEIWTLQKTYNFLNLNLKMCDKIPNTNLKK